MLNDLRACERHERPGQAHRLPVTWRNALPRFTGGQVRFAFAERPSKIRFLASPVFHCSARTTFLTTTLTTAEHLHTPSYITPGPPSWLVTPSARAYGSRVRFHPLRIRRAVRIACSQPSRSFQFVQFDQHKRLASDFASASHAEGRWFDPSRDHPYRRSSAAIIEPDYLGRAQYVPNGVDRVRARRPVASHNCSALHRHAGDALISL
jgi:hypothetical protein